jgi:hypothetical protein
MRRLVKFLLVAAFVAIGYEAHAVSQWSRKYGVSCTTCHSAFPRINKFGEEFMQNGFQMPGDQDGDEAGKMQIGDRLALSELVDIFGIRLNITPVEYKTNNRLKADGTFGDEFDVGIANWLQLFTAGSIYKNVSIFIETEITEDSIHTSWFTLGFHNLFGQGGLANVRVGRLSALEWHSLAGRLRQIPAIKNQVISRYKSSAGKGDDSVAIAAAYPAIEYYGYTGRYVWSAGIQNGAKSNDPNDDKNFFGTVKVYILEDGDFAGSSVSVAGMYGADTAVVDIPDPADASVVARSEEAANDFWRVSPAFNLRYKESTDFQIGYFTGSDDNWTLSLDSPVTVDFDSISALIGHWINETYWVAAQYDWIDSDDKSQDFNNLTGTVYVFPRDNLRAGLIARADLDSVGEDVHELFINIRTMF